MTSNNSHVVFTTLSNLSTNDVVLLISETGETREIIKAARICKNRNITVIGITRFSNNTLSKYLNYTLFTCNDLSDSRLNAMTIRCSQLFIIDMLVLNILKCNIKKYGNNIHESEKLLNEDYFGSQF